MTVDVRIAELERALIERIGAPRYQLWFHGHTRFHFDGESIIVGVPNLHFQDWLQKTYGPDVEHAVRVTLGMPVKIQFRIDPELFRSARAEQEQAKLEAGVDSPRKPQVELPPDSSTDLAPAARRKKKDSPTPSMFPAGDATIPLAKPSSPARRWHSLKHFVEGACNRVAFAAALSVVDDPGQGANPLVVHGSIGTGKTHLLEGIFVGLRRRYHGLAVRFASAEDFTNRFVQAMRFGKLAAFRKHYRECDVLLIDDLHFLASKKATQEEFLHTFDALLAGGKQIVATTDCHPRLADDLLPELTDRMLGGAIWGLQPPDRETRIAILRAKSVAEGALIADEVLTYVADKLRGNVRELEGVIRNLRHFAKVHGKPIDLPLAKEALGDLLRHAVRVVSVADVDVAVCQAMRLPGGTLQSKMRSWAVSHPRMLAIYLARKHTAASYGEIGQHFGGRNHSTAVAAEKKIRSWLAKDESLSGSDKAWRVRELVEVVERILGV